MIGYSICDDDGVWVVINAKTAPAPFEVDRWLITVDAAQDECNLRNFQDGSSNEDGELYLLWSKLKQQQWQRVHLARADCTCRQRGIV